MYDRESSIASHMPTRLNCVKTALQALLILGLSEKEIETQSNGHGDSVVSEMNRC